MPVTKITNNYPQFTLLAAAIEQIVDTIATGENIRFESVNIIVSDDATVNRLKMDYFQKDVLTDTISFNYNDTNQAIDGEIYLSIDRIRENAATYGNTFIQELSLVIIHSLLHLIGYDDSTAALKEQMDKKQRKYLEQIEPKHLCRMKS